MIKSQIPISKSQINPKSQIPITKRIKFGKLIMGYCLLFGYWCLVIGISPTFAQDSDKLVTLSKQIIEAKTNAEAYPVFKELTDLYFQENKYNEYVEYLNSLAKQKKTLEPLINYYIGFSRYYQLKYLEEKQSWDEYFSQGNAYREEIVSALQKTIASVAATEAVGVYARLSLWKFHRDQNDALSDAALSDALNATLEYAQSALDLTPIKDVAAEFLAYAEKAKAKELYKIYVDRLVASQIKDDELNTAAIGFYQEGNVDLAQSLYDVYIERIQKTLAKEKLLPILIDIAKLFAYRDEGQNDAFYAEKIFKKIEDIGTKDAFNEELIYLRAFNLEKAKEYQQAKDTYVNLVQRYPQTAHRDEADFKQGIIYTYILRDIKTGRSYFEKLAQKEITSPQAISSLYQLGLLSQWEEDKVKAQGYYNKLIERAKDGFSETVTLAKQRLKEIAGAKPIEYNLKTFLDASLKEEYASFDMTKLDLKSHPYRLKKDGQIDIKSSAYTAESGCLQVELQYLWSGHLGNTQPTNEQSSFATQYLQSGSKEINLVVVSPAGIIDRNIDLVDVY